jgi:hypothetical protein
MEIELLIDTRNAMMFSLLLASGALFPETPLDLPREILLCWKRLKAAVRSMKARKRGRSSRSFWVIDMTKFEP